MVQCIPLDGLWPWELWAHTFSVSEHKGINYLAQTQVTLRKVLSQEGPE